MMNVFAPTQQALSDLGHSFGNRPIRELNNMRVDEERTRLAGIEAQRQEDTELKEILSSVSDEQKNVTRFNFYKERNPEKATEIATEVMKQGNQLMKLDPEGAIDYINSNLGTSYEYVGKKEKLIQIDDPNGGVTRLVDPYTGKEVQKFDITKPKPKPQSKLGKEQADLKAGIITQEQIDAANEESSTPATDIDDFVTDADAESLRTTGKPLTPGQRNEARLEMKRAQSREVRANRLAEKEVDAATAERIKYNEKIGSRLAEIATAGALITAKGEVSPQVKMDMARSRMSGNLATLANHYVTLNSTGAILNVDNGTFTNTLAAARSSMIGQAFGRITGTNEQSIRSSIKKIKPLLVQDIRQATDMGARGLDSDKELEFYLQAATDEKTDIQSNIAAIVVLDEAFGEGKVSEQLRGLTNESLIRRISDQGQDILTRGEAKGGDNKNKKFIDTLPEGSVLQTQTAEGGKPVYMTPDGTFIIDNGE